MACREDDPFKGRPARAEAPLFRCFTSCGPPVVETGDRTKSAGAINEGDQSPAPALERLPRRRASTVRRTVSHRVGAGHRWEIGGGAAGVSPGVDWAAHLGADQEARLTSG